MELIGKSDIQKGVEFLSEESRQKLSACYKNVKQKCTKCKTEYETRKMYDTGLCRECDYERLIEEAKPARAEFENMQFASFGFGERHASCSFENYEIFEERQRDIVAQLKYFAVKNEKDKGVYLWGETGAGKTHLLAAIGRVVYYKHGVKPYRIHMLNLLRVIRKAYNSRLYSEQEILERFCSEKYLIIDDIGMEKITEWSLQMIGLIVNTRYENKLATSYASNLKPEELAAKTNARITSRITDSCLIVSFEGIMDYRDRRKFL
jgi:DNA replication protein DnaC